MPGRGAFAHRRAVAGDETSNGRADHVFADRADRPRGLARAAVGITGRIPRRLAGRGWFSPRVLLDPAVRGGRPGSRRSSTSAPDEREDGDRQGRGTDARDHREPRASFGRSSAQLGTGRVGFGRGLLRRLGRTLAVGHGGEMGRHVVAEQAPRAQLDVCEAGGVEPASTTFADVNRSLLPGFPGPAS